ncbi:DUF1980 domain-containing protein [Paenibacillus xylaniclasticus]|uniref:DUF1980 domain-containing protein n=1 Tax=Paenibacillus xylaniclasticus TaxID=588083 RepID=UPI000FD8572C|nr:MULTISPECIES: DUF1980 domain-containing protein [Paenibacillus]GFN31203.1 hypothetical protein PCURB6_14630 [Paenibacillus curdlanolyticus]
MDRILVPTLVAHYLLRAAMLAGFSMLIIYLKHTGELSLFVSSRTEQGIKLTALGLMACASYQAFSAFQMLCAPKHTVSCGCGTYHHGEAHASDDDHGHSHTPSNSLLRNLIIYSLFALPLLLGFAVPHKPVDNTFAAEKHMNNVESYTEPVLKPRSR